MFESHKRKLAVTTPKKSILALTLEAGAVLKLQGGGCNCFMETWPYFDFSLFSDGFKSLKN